jgi:hypothetical protein
MAGTDPPGGPANGMRMRVTMKMLKNHLMVYRSHLILADRPEDRSLPAIFHISFSWTARRSVPACDPVAVIRWLQVTSRQG